MQRPMIIICKGTRKTIDGEWCDHRSPLGNPFHLDSEAQRDAVCDAYQEYFQGVINGFEPIPLAANISKLQKVVAAAWAKPTRAEFLAAIDRLSTILKTTGTITLNCWCINAIIQSRADLGQKKRCHCLAIAAHLLPEVGRSTEQLTIEAK